MNAVGPPRRVCLITPGHLATNPRIIKEADALSEAGFDVSVIAADYVDWARKADAEFADRPWRVARKVRFGPHAPKPDYIAQTVRRRAARALARLGMTHQALIEAAQHPIGYDLVRAAMSVPADLYVAHYVAAIPAAARAARLHGAKFAFDAEDFHQGDFPDDEEFSFERGLVRRIEERYLGACAYLTAASPGIADAYMETYGLAPPTVVLNVFPRSQAAQAPTAAGTAVPGPSVYWFSQTIGPNRGLETAVRALALSSAHPHLYLRGTPSPGYADALLALAHQHGVNGRIHFLDPAPPSSMERLAAIYDLGLAGESGWTRNNSLALANKLFSYLLAGVPVLASSTPAHLGFAPSASEALFVFKADSPSDFARVMDSLLLDRDRLAKARLAAWRLGQDRYNWDMEKQILLSTVRRALDLGPPHVT